MADEVADDTQAQVAKTDRTPDTRQPDVSGRPRPWRRGLPRTGRAGALAAVITTFALATGL